MEINTDTITLDCWVHPRTLDSTSAAFSRANTSKVSQQMQLNQPLFFFFSYLWHTLNSASWQFQAPPMRTKAHQEFFPSRLYLLCMNPKVVPQKLQNWILKRAGESCSRIWWCIIFNSDKGGGEGGLGGIPDWLLRCIRQHGVWEGQKELACSDCDLCNRQAPSHSKHAISPQTEACFSTTHGFNWRLLLLCLQLWKKKKRRKKKKNSQPQPGIARQTWLWNQSLANKNQAGSVAQTYDTSVVRWWRCDEMAIWVSRDFLKSICLFVFVFVCEQACI